MEELLLVNLTLLRYTASAREKQPHSITIQEQTGQEGGLKAVTEDWTFAQLTREETLWGPHGYHRYPAKFIPQLVSRLIKLYSAPSDLVGDPFLGSAAPGAELA